MTSTAVVVPEEKPPAPRVSTRSIRASDLGVEMVDFYVGNSEKHFKVHKKLVCEAVKAFDKMFNGKFKESETLTARLPDEDPDAFDIFVGWLYSKTLDPLIYDPKSDEGFYRLSLYSMAEKYGIDSLLDITMDSIVDWYCITNVVPHEATIRETYERSPEGSKLRIFMLRSLKFKILRGIDFSSIGDVIKPYCELLEDEDIRYDFVKAIHGEDGILALNPNTEPRCDYHVHGKKGYCSYESRGKSS